MSEFCLPCKNIISMGKCSYGSRCRFIHDYRCLYNKYDNRIYDKTISRRKPFAELDKDLFFWPEYYSEQGTYEPPDNSSIKSIWFHFINACNNIILDDEKTLVNGITGKKRLDIFISLSNN